MKKMLGVIVASIFLLSSSGFTTNPNNSNDLFLQKNFQDINSSIDYIDTESPYTNPSTLTNFDTPRDNTKNNTASKKETQKSKAAKQKKQKNK